MDVPSRIAFFREDAGLDSLPGDRCRACGVPTGEVADHVRGVQDAAPPACRHCGYPENGAAFVDYDGC